MLTDLIFGGIIRTLETVSDVIEYGPTEAVKINTALIPQAERDYRNIMGNINKPSFTSLSSEDGEKKTIITEKKLDNDKISCQKSKDDNLEKFGAWVEEIKISFSSNSSNIDLGLIYDYYQLNAYGKVLMDKVSSNIDAKERVAEKQLEKAVLFKERCQKGECDKYAFIFWALMILAVDDTDKEEHLSKICDFSKFLKINEEEMMNIVRLIYVVCQNRR